MVNNASNWTKDMKVQIQEAQRILNRKKKTHIRLGIWQLSY